MSLCHYTYIYGIKLHNNGWSKEELECDEEEKIIQTSCWSLITIAHPQN